MFHVLVCLDTKEEWTKKNVSVEEMEHEVYNLLFSQNHRLYVNGSLYIHI